VTALVSGIVVLLGFGTAGAAGALEAVRRDTPATVGSSAPSTAPGSTAPGSSSGGRLDIVKVSGLIDPVNTDLLKRSLAAAAGDHALALVIQLNSTGGTISQGQLDALTFRITHGPVPVAIWVGGSSRPRAYGAAYGILRSGDFTGAGPGSRVGKELPPLLRAPDGLEHRTISGDDAVDKGLVNVSSPTLVDFLGELDGKTIKGTTLHLGASGQPGTPGRGFRRDLQFAFSQLSIVPKLLHTAASPNVAFVMLLIAMCLAVFEFFTAGVGVAAGTGVVFGLLSAYGLGVLPTRGYAVALLALSVIGCSIDVQAGAPRVWTAIGVAAYAVGAVRLYDGQAVSVWVLVVMGLLLVLFMVSGMPAMVRTRFSTPTIGRESMIGEMGVALSGVEPEGTVQVNGAPWRARTNRATPIPAGEPVRVVAIDGLLLEVEPETGGARDARH